MSNFPLQDGNRSSIGPNTEEVKDTNGEDRRPSGFSTKISPIHTPGSAIKKEN